MQTKREWLAERGLAIAGARGKFSNAAKAALEQAEREGVKFSDATKISAPTKISTEKSAGGQKPAKSDPGMSAYFFPDEYRYPEAEYRATVLDNGKKREVSLRECCNTCRVSLVNHACASPTIHSGIPVTIERR